MNRPVSRDPETPPRPARIVSAERIPQPESILETITRCVARDFGIDPRALLAPTRGAPRVAFARQVAMYLAHVGFAQTFAAIGRMFHRDRTTVAHACRVVEDGRDDDRLDRRLAALERACRGLPGGAGEGYSRRSRCSRSPEGRR